MNIADHPAAFRDRLIDPSDQISELIPGAADDRMIGYLHLPDVHNRLFVFFDQRRLDIECGYDVEIFKFWLFLSGGQDRKIFDNVNIEIFRCCDHFLPLHDFIEGSPSLRA